jgi:outer membrane protein assembly factor BamB
MSPATQFLSPLFAVCLLTFGLSLAAQDKPTIGWRTDARGNYPAAMPPTKWSPTENIVWKTQLPGRSFGSPILVGDQLFVPSDPAELLCVNAASGEIIWRKSNSAAEVLGADKANEIAQRWGEVNEEKKQKTKAFDEFRKANPEAKDEQERMRNEVNALEAKLDLLRRESPIQQDRGAGNSAATPVSDGKHVYCAFGSGIVGCYTLAGEKQWLKFIEGSLIGFGHSSSPLLVDGKLIVHFHDLVALDPTTGEIVWRTKLNASHASPIAFRWENESLLVSPAGAIVRVKDGKVLVNDPALRTSESSSIAHGGTVFSQEGKTTAFKLPADIEKGLDVLWQASASRGRRTPSPVLHDGLIYGATTEGIFEVTDAETGDLVYRKRLDFDGNLYSSVTAAGPYIFLGCTKGTTLVLKAGREYEEVAHNKLEDYGSNPIFAGKRMYLRGQKNLYCVGE